MKEKLETYRQNVALLQFLGNKPDKNHKEFELFYSTEEHAIKEEQEIKKLILTLKKWEYRVLLNYRYLHNLKWQHIIHYFFGHEADYQANKDGKYKHKIMRWHRQALKNLER